jgi:hypothetical protein
VVLGHAGGRRPAGDLHRHLDERDDLGSRQRRRSGAPGNCLRIRPGRCLRPKRRLRPG